MKYFLECCKVKFFKPETQAEQKQELEPLKSDECKAAPEHQKIDDDPKEQTFPLFCNGIRS